MMSYACQHGIYGTCSYCRVEAEEAKEIQRTQAQARIQELEGLVREMAPFVKGGWCGKENKNSKSYWPDWGRSEEILNREIVKSIMEKVKCPQ